MPSNIEIGAAREEELDAVLQIMCEAFDMPHEAAGPIYYSDPELDPAKKWVLRVAGQVISCLTFVDRKCWIGDAVVPFVGIAGVATLAAHRGQGYAGRLLQDAARTLGMRGVPLSLLTTVSPDYYRRFGWEVCTQPRRLIFRREVLQRYPCSKHVRAAVPADIPALSALYDRKAKGHTLHCVRGHRSWSRLLTQPARIMVYAPNAQDLEGYLVFDSLLGQVAVAANQEEHLPLLRVQEMTAFTEEARHALLGALAMRLEMDWIAWDAQDRSEIRAIGFKNSPSTLATAGLHTEAMPGTLARICSFERLIAQMASHWPLHSARLLLVLEDSLLAAPIRLRVSCDGTGPWHVQSLAAAGGLCDHVDMSWSEVRGDVTVWSQVAVGYRPLGSEATLSRLRLLMKGMVIESGKQSEVRELLKILFFPSSPGLPLPDHF